MKMFFKKTWRIFLAKDSEIEMLVDDNITNHFVSVVVIASR